MYLLAYLLVGSVLHAAIKGALFVCFSFWLRVLDKAVYSAFESTLNSSIVSYRIVSYRYIHRVRIKTAPLNKTL